MPQLADKYSCTGCLACHDSCPKQAISSFWDEEGHLTYNVDITLCIECGLCEKTCPVVSGYQYGNNSLKESHPYAAWTKNNELRAKSTSGGVFAALAKYIIKKGGVVIGASMHHNCVRHILIDKEEDIAKLQGSKYTQSNTDGIFKTVKQLLREGREVLFSGMGCQVAGLLSYLGKMDYSGQLHTVDLICGGVPSRFLIDYYLKENPEVDEVVSFRNNSKYEFSVQDKSGKKKVVPLSERPFPLCGFYTELTNRYSCYDCKFIGAHRKSDITIGDFWGDNAHMEEHAKGISIAVTHTENGRNLLYKAEIEAHEAKWEIFLMHNPRMIDGYKRASQSKARRNLAKAFSELSYESLLQIYANKATLSQPLLMAKKIYRYMIGRVKGRIYRRHLKNAISNLLRQ